MTDPWVNQSGKVVHPNAPSGGGGPGYFSPGTPLGLGHDPFSPVPHPHSPAARHLALNEIQKKHPKGKVAAQPAPQWKDDDALNAKVKAEADGYVGKPVVGDGECYALVDKLLPEAGAKSAPQFMPKITPDGDYIWGHPIELKDIKPGDILQFRKETMDINTVTIRKKIDPDTHKILHTEKTERSLGYDRGFPNHTSVVSSIDRDTGVVTVVEQHVIDRLPDGTPTKNLSKVVRRNTLYLSSTTRTLPKKVTKESLHVVVEEETTLEIKVSGQIKAYRPQPTGP